MDEKIKQVYVKSNQIGVIIQHYKPTFKYRFEDLPLLVNEVDAEFLVKDNPAMFSIAKGYKPPKETTKVPGIDLDKASKDDLLDYTAKHSIEADYSMSVMELRKKIMEAI